MLIVRKSDGGYGYGTTDLASIRYRIDDLHADRLIYITDARQSQHFQHGLRRRRARRLDRAPTTPSTSGSGRCWARTASRSRPARAGRSGSRTCSTTRSCAPARVVDAKSPELPEAERAEIARAVGIGAVKYADLSTTRQRDLLFSFDRMLALDGNTAPYLLYACVRAASIVAKAGETSSEVTVLAEPQERALVVKLSGLRRRAAPRSRRHARAAPALQLPLRAGRRVHRVLRGVPGAQGADGETRALAARAVRADRGDAQDRPRAARHHRAGAHVSSSTRAPSRRFSASSRHVAVDAAGDGEAGLAVVVDVLDLDRDAGVVRVAHRARRGSRARGRGR